MLATDITSLAIYGSDNVLEQTSKHLADVSSKSLKVTYQKLGKKWLVLSGQDGNEIFYRRLEFGRGDIIHAFLLEYLASAKAKYGTLVNSIAESLNGP